MGTLQWLYHPKSLAFIGKNSSLEMVAYNTKTPFLFILITVVLSFLGGKKKDC